MRKLIYGIGSLLIIGWAVGFFGLHAGHWIHLLMVVGTVAILMNIIIES